MLSEPTGFLSTPAWARTQRGARDGLKTDQFGNIFAAGAGGIHVFAPDGSHLGSIKIHEASNVAWGDDGSVLYITSSKAIYRIQTLTAGHGI
jgi:gluconolactonase